MTGDAANPIGVLGREREKRGKTIGCEGVQIRNMQLWRR
jgi:hypothetical protein